MSLRRITENSSSSRIPIHALRRRSLRFFPLRFPLYIGILAVAGSSVLGRPVHRERGCGRFDRSIVGRIDIRIIDRRFFCRTIRRSSVVEGIHILFQSRSTALSRIHVIIIIRRRSSASSLVIVVSVTHVVVRFVCVTRRIRQDPRTRPCLFRTPKTATTGLDQLSGFPDSRPGGSTDDLTGFHLDDRGILVIASLCIGMAFKYYDRQRRSISCSV